MAHPTGSMLMAAVLLAAALVAPEPWWLPLQNRAAAGEGSGEAHDSSALLPATVEEARARATILHETIHATLQIVHRDYFLEDDPLNIPSRSLEEVFEELERLHQVEVRWLAVNADAMSVDHEPQTPFEHEAVRELAAGKEAFEAVLGGLYRRVGSIQLPSQCLKCHVAHRASTEERAAGLIITMPLKNDGP